MHYKWIDYTSEHTSVVEEFLDNTARRMTGCDDGWNEYYKSLRSEPDICFGKDFWMKMIFTDNQPIAVIAMGLHDGTLTISELVVSPNMRGMGHGTAILRELLDCFFEITAVSFERAMAVIFPNNKASQRAFEKAGFVFESAHPDGDAWYYAYKNRI